MIRFGYDALDRLLNSTGHYDDLAYRYDPVGNHLGLALNNEEALYNYILGSNTLADIQHPDSRNNVTYQSDSHGNTTRRVQGNRTHDFRYNAANRLEQVTETGQGSTRYTYNALGQRTLKADNSTTQYYLYYEQGLLLGEYDDNGNAITEYVWFNGQPLVQLKGNQVYYYHNDHLGTPRVLTDQNQQVVWEARYTPFGEASVSTETVANNLRFTGQYFDSETNLHYNWWRYYDPTTGRYPTPDKVGLRRDYSDPQLQVAIGLRILEETGLDGKPFNLLYDYALQNPSIYSDEAGLGPARTIGVICVVLSSLTDSNLDRSLGSIPRPDFNPAPLVSPRCPKPPRKPRCR